ncbi:MAG TPA: Holliday junction resolvase RuvX, partial [Myxococcota bacterium]|nr:Holliday junction resolvase RuvX [Myxococcota bacterium]
MGAGYAAPGLPVSPVRRAGQSVEARYTPRVRILGIDLGNKRIGLAISDELGSIAFPAGVLASRGRRRDLEALRDLIREREIGAAVVGLPIHMDGRRGPEAERATTFANDLAALAGVPVETLDERWTSIEAERLLEAGGRGRGRPARDPASSRSRRRGEATRAGRAGGPVLEDRRGRRERGEDRCGQLVDLTARPAAP